MQGHNIEDKIKELVVRYVECDEQSALLNDKRKEIREEVESLGQSSKAFQDNISRIKKDRRKKEGYDESFDFIRGVIGEIDQGVLFDWMDEREEKRQAEREEKLRKREKDKEKNDSFKPAPERKPKAKKAS